MRALRWEKPPASMRGDDPTRHTTVRASLSRCELSDTLAPHAVTLDLRMQRNVVTAGVECL